MMCFRKEIKGRQILLLIPHLMIKNFYSLGKCKRKDLSNIYQLSEKRMCMEEESAKKLSKGKEEAT